MRPRQPVYITAGFYRHEVGTIQERINGDSFRVMVAGISVTLFRFEIARVKPQQLRASNQRGH